MKKSTLLNFAAMTLCVCIALLTLAGCGGKTEVSLQQMVDANSNETLLKQYGSLLFEQGLADGTSIVYRTADFKCFTNDGFYYEGFLDGRYYCYDGEYFAALGCYDMDISPLEQQTVFDEEATLAETVTGTEKDGDTIRLTTSVSPESSQIMLETIGFEYVPGDTIAYEYVLDADTLVMRESILTICHEDGTTGESRRQILTPDAGMPEVIGEIYKRLTTENQRELTIVLDPGTAEEQSYTGFYVEGDCLCAFLPDGYTTLYTDEACTQVYASGSDVGYLTYEGTLYSVKD